MTTTTIDLDSILALPVEARLRLAQSIWESLPDEVDEPDISDELATELSRRLDAYRANPDRVKTWDEVEAAILARSTR